MALRRPLYYTDSGNIKEMNDLELADVHAEAKKFYLSNPPVQLTVVNSGGNLGGISQSQVIAGAATNNKKSVNNNSPGGITVDTINYSRINETKATPPFGANGQFDLTTLKNNLGTNWPVYYNDSGNFEPFTDSDFLDTFANPVIQELGVANSDPLYVVGESAGVVSSRYTKVSNTPVYTDLIANITAYNQGNLPESRTQSVTVQNWYLWKLKSGRTGQVFIDVDYRDSAFNRPVLGVGFKLDLEKVPGGNYIHTIRARGTGYVVSDNFIVEGTKLGGNSPENDFAYYVNSIDSFGGVTSLLPNVLKNGVGNFYRQPLTHTDSATSPTGVHLRSIKKSDLETMINTAMTHQATTQRGQQIEFKWNKGSQVGTTIIDTRLTNPTETRRNQAPPQSTGSDNYRSQRVPTGGNQQTVATHYLGVRIL